MTWPRVAPSHYRCGLVTRVIGGTCDRKLGNPSDSSFPPDTRNGASAEKHRPSFCFSTNEWSIHHLLSACWMRGSKNEGTAYGHRGSGSRERPWRLATRGTRMIETQSKYTAGAGQASSQPLRNFIPSPDPPSCEGRRRGSLRASLGSFQANVRHSLNLPGRVLGAVSLPSGALTAAGGGSGPSAG